MLPDLLSYYSTVCLFFLSPHEKRLGKNPELMCACWLMLSHTVSLKLTDKIEFVYQRRGIQGRLIYAAQTTMISLNDGIGLKGRVAPLPTPVLQ